MWTVGSGSIDGGAAKAAEKSMTNAGNKVAVITGAARGIGKATAERLSQDGYSLALTDIDEDAVTEVAQFIVTQGGVARAYHLDVRHPRVISAVFDAVAADLGVPSALVNNAGIYPDVTALEMSEADWDAVLDVNLKGTFFTSQTFARRRRDAGGGAIVNVASTSAFSARAGASHYAASKAGIVMLTKCLALEFRDLSVRVNAVAPGLIEVREGQFLPEYRDQFLTMIPRGRIGEPSDISGVIGFLFSPAADFVNGECIVADGGFLAGRPLRRISVQ